MINSVGRTDEASRMINSVGRTDEAFGLAAH
jgi:hypothetical protein